MDAVVLAGGRARRLGGADKATLEIGGRRLIDRVLDAVPGDGVVVVVGPRRSVGRPVIWTREEPAGGGPAAALAAGLAQVTAPSVAVAGVDHPFLTAGAFDKLASAGDGRDGAIAVDAQGRDQYLVGVYVAARLRAALEGRRALKDAIFDLDLARVEDARASFDVDSEADLREAERYVRRMG